ncbi:hypothetical protein, partial [Pandoraea anhela]|uniref:hypothetical protein n=1 Tax=Pandoraea anhela TaxID=2508295 RepID=UPI001C2CF1BB
ATLECLVVLRHEKTPKGWIYVQLLGGTSATSGVFVCVTIREMRNVTLSCGLDCSWHFCAMSQNLCEIWADGHRRIGQFF